MDAEAILRAKYPEDLVDALLAAYKVIESNYVAEKWKAAELDAGHFVEAARRILEFEITPPHTPLTKGIARFNDAALRKFEIASGDDSYRMLIPRALYAIYGIRNKRGVGHLGGISPNEMDSTYILYSVKWVLAELVRLASGASVADTQRAVNNIVERAMVILWKHEDLTRVLDPKMTARDQVLVLLYDRSPQTEASLREAVEYKNKTNFAKILDRLHKGKLIFRGSDGVCTILPPGIRAAEEIIQRKR